MTGLSPNLFRLLLLLYVAIHDMKRNARAKTHVIRSQHASNGSVYPVIFKKIFVIYTFSCILHVVYYNNISAQATSLLSFSIVYIIIGPGLL